MLIRSYKIGTCWICQSTGPLTREHKFKASGLREQIDSIGPFTVVVGNQMDSFRIAQGRKSDALKFRFISQNDPLGPDPDNELGTKQPSIDDFLNKNYSSLEATPFGYIDPSEKERKIHIFFI